MYDIIGDIHGHADELIELLETMGYESRNGIYAHPERTSVFVGDFIDRGPQIAEVLRIVRAMVDTGSAKAVMGNHEFNAIAYNTPHPKKSGEFLRKHTNKNRGQHEMTIRQLGDEINHAIDWFRELPLWLDLGELRIVHASWDQQDISAIDYSLKELGGVNDQFMARATSKTETLHDAIEDILKGKELPLPLGISFNDKDGNERTDVRIRWYESPRGKSYQEYSLPSRIEIPTEPIPDSVAEQVTPYDPSEPPVFFGHYWLKSNRPSRLATNVTCVDYSVAAGGSLCAYRWDGERELLDDKFVWVDAKRG